MKSWVRLAAFAAGATLAGQEANPPTFKARTAQVRVDLEVVNGMTPVDGLAANHFLVKDNGEPQSVLHVSQQEEPLDIILLFDVSGSMQQPVARAASAARKAMEQLRPGDRIGVMVFSSKAKLVQSFTDDPETIRRAIQEKVVGQPFEGATHIWDAVDQAAGVMMLEKRSGRRRAILVVTDNFGQRNELDEDTAIRDLWEADAVVAGLIVTNPKEGRKRERRRVTVDRLAEETGGESILADDPGAGFADLVLRLRKRYSLYYAMPLGKAGESRQVRVELQGTARDLYPQARVRARKGYTIEAE